MGLLERVFHSNSKVRFWVGGYVEIDLFAIFVSAISLFVRFS